MSDVTAQRLAASEAGDRVTLEQIGARIGYGRSIQILGLAWHDRLQQRWGIDDPEGTHWRARLRETIAECTRLLEEGGTPTAELVIVSGPDRRLSPADREALEAALALPTGPRQWQKLDFLLDGIMGLHHADKARYLIAVDDALRAGQP